LNGNLYGPAGDSYGRVSLVGYSARDFDGVSSQVWNSLIVLSIQVQSNADVKSVNVELTKEKLNAMLDGLGKIRDQLASVAGSS